VACTASADSNNLELPTGPPTAVTYRGQRTDGPATPAPLRLHLHPRDNSYGAVNLTLATIRNRTARSFQSGRLELTSYVYSDVADAATGS
jgi:hypothetical protein